MPTSRRSPERRSARPAPTPSPGPRHRPHPALLACALALLLAPPAHADADGRWSRLHPIARPSQAFVADPVYGGAYLFDWSAGTDPGVWRISPDADWLEVPTHGPAPTGTRPLVAFADTARGDFVVLDPTLARVWRLDRSGAWTTQPAIAPAGLRGTLAWDSRRGRPLLFGGTEDHSTDVWACDVTGDSARWTMLPSPAAKPQPREGSLVVYERRRDRLVVAGGYLVLPADGGPNYRDTWEYPLDSLAWHLTAVSDTMCLAYGWIRDGGAGVVDERRDRIVRIQAGCGNRAVVATLAGGAAAWQRLGSLPAPDRVGPPPVYDPVRDRMLMLAATGSGTAMFAMDGATGAWAQLEPGQALPPGRRAHGGAYVATADAMVVTTGRGAAALLDDTWQLPLDTLAWRPLPAIDPPAARSGATLVTLEDRTLLLFGGDIGRATNDLVTLFAMARPYWLRWPADTPPHERTRHASVSPPGRNALIVTGGEGDSIGGVRPALAGTWVWSAGAWQAMRLHGGSPPARAGHTLVWDPVRQRAILYGGDITDVDGAGAHRTVLDDTWSLWLGDSTWTRLPDGPARSGHSAVYDAVRDRMVVYGGRDASGTPTSDVWALSLPDSTWTQLAPTGLAPAGRLEHAAVYDPVRDRMVIHGGAVAASSEPSRDTWVLDWGSTARPDVEATWTPPPFPGAMAHVAVAVTGHAGPRQRYDVAFEYALQGSVNTYLNSVRVAAGERATALYDIDLPDWVEGAVAARAWVMNGIPMPVDTVHVAAFVPALVHDAHATVLPGTGIRVAWALGEAHVGRATLYRRVGDEPWQAIAGLESNRDTLAYLDADVPAGLTATYRLGFRPGSTELLRGTITVRAPGDVSGVQPWPNPARGAVSVALTLAAETTVRAAVYDLAGRRVAAVGERRFAAGTHVLRLDETTRLDPGLYFVKVWRGADAITRRVCVVR